MKNLNKKSLIYIGIGILILVFIFLGYSYGKGSFFGKEKYQAVQLLTGEVYYGKLCLFPFPKLSNVYFVQTLPAKEEDELPTTQLVPLNSLFFAPENVMYLNKNQILWWADLSENSQILQTIRQQK